MPTVAVTGMIEKIKEYIKKTFKEYSDRPCPENYVDIQGMFEGLEFLGEGAFSDVFVLKGTDYVFKFTGLTAGAKFDGYPAYARWCMGKQGQAGIPNIHHHEHYGHALYLTVMDRMLSIHDDGVYDHLTDQNLSDLRWLNDRLKDYVHATQDDIDVEDRGGIDYSLREIFPDFNDLVQTARELAGELGPFCRFDMHDGNFLFTPGMDFFIADPVASDTREVGAFTRREENDLTRPYIKTAA